MSENEPPKKPISPPNQKRTEEVRQIAQEYADDQKALAAKLGRKPN